MKRHTLFVFVYFSCLFSSFAQSWRHIPMQGSTYSQSVFTDGKTLYVGTYTGIFSETPGSQFWDFNPHGTIQSLWVYLNYEKHNDRFYVRDDYNRNYHFRYENDTTMHPIRFPQDTTELLTSISIAEDTVFSTIKSGAFWSVDDHTNWKSTTIQGADFETEYPELHESIHFGDHWYFFDGKGLWRSASVQGNWEKVADADFRQKARFSIFGETLFLYLFDSNLLRRWDSAGDSLATFIPPLPGNGTTLFRHLFILKDTLYMHYTDGGNSTWRIFKTIDGQVWEQSQTLTNLLNPINYNTIVSLRDTLWFGSYHGLYYMDADKPFRLERVEDMAHSSILGLVPTLNKVWAIHGLLPPVFTVDKGKTWQDIAQLNPPFEPENIYYKSYYFTKNHLVALEGHHSIHQFSEKDQTWESYQWPSESSNSQSEYAQLGKYLFQFHNGSIAQWDIENKSLKMIENEFPEGAYVRNPAKILNALSIRVDTKSWVSDDNGENWRMWEHVPCGTTGTEYPFRIYFGDTMFYCTAIPNRNYYKINGREVTAIAQNWETGAPILDKLNIRYTDSLLIAFNFTNGQYLAFNSAMHFFPVRPALETYYITSMRRIENDLWAGTLQHGIYILENYFGNEAPHKVETEWNLFPNPNHGAFTIRKDNISHTPVFFKVFDGQGKFLTNKRGDEGFEWELDLRHLPRGLYFIHCISMDGTTETKRVVLN